MGLIRLEWPYLLNAARIDRPNRTVRPKNTTAFNLTQTVCILSIRCYAVQVSQVPVRALLC